MKNYLGCNKSRDASVLFGVIAVVTLIGLSAAGGMWYENGIMRGKIDKILAQRERELLRMAEVLKEMDVAERSQLEDLTDPNRGNPVGVAGTYNEETGEYDFRDEASK